MAVASAIDARTPRAFEPICCISTGIGDAISGAVREIVENRTPEQPEEAAVCGESKARQGAHGWAPRSTHPYSSYKEIGISAVGELRSLLDDGCIFFLA